MFGALAIRAERIAIRAVGPLVSSGPRDERAVRRVSGPSTATVEFTGSATSRTLAQHARRQVADRFWSQCKARLSCDATSRPQAGDTHLNSRHESENTVVLLCYILHLLDRDADT